jgi:hypothetical protein
MKRLSLSLILTLLAITINAQEDLMDIVEENTSEETEIVTATFKSSRIMNGHSIERMPGGVLDFRISHRFGTLNSGAYEFWGLDQSDIRLAFEYGITDWLMVGVGRGSNEKTFDGFAKISLLRQSKGAKSMPVSVSVFTSVALKTIKFIEEQPDYITSRLAYTTQVLVARKISPALSLQITPSYIHKNLEETDPDPADIFAVGGGARVKLSKRISLNAEYFYVADPGTYLSQPVYSPFSIGVDIETGGHVFQLIFTNSLGMIEKSFISETTGQWSEGDVHFGFNISRVFNLSKKSKLSNY